MASVVARALVAVDAEKASKQDLELLKKLVMEFKDELDALGVKVDKIDKRVAVLEDRLGGWKLSGSFKFDACAEKSGIPQAGFCSRSLLPPCFPCLARTPTQSAPSAG